MWRILPEIQKKYGQELPDCQFKGNKYKKLGNGWVMVGNEKIQKLIRKVHIDEDGNVTEVQFDK